MDETVNKSYNLIKKFYDVKNSIISLDEIKPLEREFQENNYYNPDIPRILLFGEFKAGKSTLLNSILGGDYAPSDILEMTSWVARYWPSNNEFCRVTYTDGKTDIYDICEFLKKCNERIFAESELKSIDRVDIGLKNNLNFSIIDAPGFGSVNPENENRLVNAIKEADIIFWVLSCEVIGGMREAAYINHFKETNTPYVCILTKCDLLDYDEQVDEAKQYIAEETETKEDLIFPISVSKYKNHDSIEIARMKEIHDYINNNITVQNKDLRKQSQNGHEIRIKDHCLNLLSRVSNELNEAINGRDRYGLILDSSARIVDAKMETMILDYARNNLYTEYKSPLINKISKANPQNIDLEIRNILETTLPPDYMDKFWNSLNSYTEKIKNDLWAESIQEKLPEINKLQNSLTATKFNDVIAFGNDLNSFITVVNNVSNDTFKTGVMTSLGIAGAASAYVALLGPAAASITIGAAATGIGLPIAVIGIGVAAGLKFIKRDKSKSFIVDANSIYEKVKDQFIIDMISKSFIPEIKRINKQTVNNLIEKYESNISSKLPSGKLDIMSMEVEDLLNEIKNGSSVGVVRKSEKTCPYCGNNNINSLDFCMNCGNRV